MISCIASTPLERFQEQLARVEFACFPVKFQSITCSVFSVKIIWFYPVITYIVNTVFKKLPTLENRDRKTTGLLEFGGPWEELRVVSDRASSMVSAFFKC